MKITSVNSLAIPEIKVIKFERFADHRGYFTEPFRKSDFKNNPEMSFMKDVKFLQANESYSHEKVIRGLHFQWNPYMGKLVRVLYGHMIDLVLDIRKTSPTFGKIIAYDMPVDTKKQYGEWIWIPPGFAHGNVFTEESMIEYFCSGEYSPGCEAGISPFSQDIDWSICDPSIKSAFDSISKSESLLISDKDKNGLSVSAWEKDERSNNFIYGKL
ncbi:MAG: dTDP-4-dehydrorhamnose 3,5-epimerase family protein [Candidatus Gracilibacteria bacterium]|jgi:dTDP-4-dehydrorhamnose 3,5-epimerase